MTDQLHSTPPDTDAALPARPAHRRGVRRVLWALLAFWLAVMTAWAALHAFILPRIDDYRGWLQQRISRSVGTQVEVGPLQVQGNWLMPWVEARDVVLFDAQGREALRLPRVVAAFSPLSVLQGGLAQLVIDQPSLDIRRDAQGHWWVAGMALHHEDDDTAGADWFFSQPEFILRGGTITWRDEWRHGIDGPTLSLREVDVVMRNRLHWHDLRIDATPPSDFGQRVSVRGQFSQTPLHRRGDWFDWRGEAYADMPHVDLANLRQWVHMDKALTLDEGRGALRLWVDVRQGMPVGLLADVQLDAVKVRLGADLQPLGLQKISGRLGAHWYDEEVELYSQNLLFDTDEGEHWPGGDWRVSWRGEDARSGAVHADRLDLEALAQVAQRVPLPEHLRRVLARSQPSGTLRQFQASWQRPDDPARVHFSAKGTLDNFGWQRDATLEGAWGQLPGVSSAHVEFDVSEHAGKAKLAIRDGSLTLPQGLAEPHLLLADAAVQLAWQQQGEQLQVQFSQGRVANADLAGEFSGQWKTGEGTTPLPGVLDLTASLTRGHAAAVHRYLPDGVPADVRRYVREAVTAGELSKGKLRIKGALDQLPFTDASQGEFRIAAQVSQGRYAYVLPQAKSPDWPALTDVQGELVFERNGLQFKGATRLEHAPGIAWQKVEAQIADFRQARVKVRGEARGPLEDLLRMVAKSALNDLIDKVLEKAQGNGQADYSLSLDLPLDNLKQTKVQGTVNLQGNDLQAIAGTPVLTRASGELSFSEQGFALKNVKGQMLGGPAELQGGLRFGTRDGDSPVQLHVKGQVSADGLRQARELGFVSRLALRANGRTDYQATVGLRRNQPELLITSDLKGMAFNLPAPLNKAAAVTLPLRVETQLTRESLAPKSKLLQDQLRISLGRVLALAYVRDLSRAEPAVLQGGIAVGQAAASGVLMTANGVALNLQWPNIDLDAWNNVLSEWTGTPVMRSLAKRDARGAKSNTIGGLEATAGNAMDYVPATLAVVADQVRVSDRILHKVIAGGTRVGDLWKLNLSADELNGAIELRPPTGNTPAQFYARLSYLVVPPSLVSDVDTMLTPQPSSIPSLDVVVQDFTLRNKKLGRLEVEAVNRTGRTAASREWVLNKLNLTMPEASFTAKGNWAADGPRVKRTQLNFALVIRDSGDLLARFGMPDVVRDGEGKIEGQLSWLGSPITLDYPSLSGKFNIGIDKGQFLKTEPGAARLLGILNLQALPRRLTLDFSDIFYEGFAFDFFRGDVRIEQGVAYTNNLQMKGVSAAALIEGQSNLFKETQDLKVVVVPEINAGNASLYMATINPLIGLTSYLAQLVLSKPLVKAGTTEFRIDGTWSNPRVTKVDS